MTDRYLISFDDTDNPETLGTGHALARFLGALPVESGYITRHQLFVDDAVPFTSHNSAMCATVEGGMGCDELVERAARCLEAERADGSDPGLCVAELPAIAHPELLVKWGLRAKSEVLAKSDAYDLARACCVHLSEHGGDGQGVIGALAAVGLRLSGNDGRVRGRSLVDVPRCSVRELLDRTGFDNVVAYGEGPLPDDCIVELGGGDVKAVYRNFECTVLATRTADTYRLLEKRHLRLY